MGLELDERALAPVAEKLLKGDTAGASAALAGSIVTLLTGSVFSRPPPRGWRSRLALLLNKNTRQRLEASGEIADPHAARAAISEAVASSLERIHKENRDFIQQLEPPDQEQLVRFIKSMPRQLHEPQDEEGVEVSSEEIELEPAALDQAPGVPAEQIGAKGGMAAGSTARDLSGATGTASTSREAATAESTGQVARPLGTPEPATKAKRSLVAEDLQQAAPSASEPDQDESTIVDAAWESNGPAVTATDSAQTADAEERPDMVRRRNTPVEALAHLAEHKHAAVRATAAANPSTPPEILAELAKDADYGVRAAAARNPNTPADLLAYLAEDEDSQVRAQVGANPSAPSQLRAKLAADLDELVRSRVAPTQGQPEDAASAGVPDPIIEVSDEGAGISSVPAAAEVEQASYSDSPIIRTDSPATEDCLGREGFCDALATRLGLVWKQAQVDQGDEPGHSFVMHLYAPWGAGKSTLLRLLKFSLGRRPVDDSKGWLVVNFNAWRHQHVDPPWWPLLDRIEREITRQRWWMRLRVYWWRFWIARSHQFVPIAVTALAVAILVWRLQKPDSFADFATWIAGAATVIGAIWSVVTAMTRTLIPGSSAAARAFQRAASDPMETLRQHFARLVKCIAEPIIVLIDDLDRCRPDYVVSLLEAVQTLYCHSGVFYVVAADRRWISSCYAASYEKLGGQIQEPGRSIGYLFLDKLFQLAVPVPAMSPTKRDEYLRYLVKPDDGQQQAGEIWRTSREEQAEIARVKQRIQKARSETEIHQEVEAASPKVKAAIVDDAIRRRVSPDVVAATQHRLVRFAPLMDANPRAMKLLTSAYGVYVDHALASGIEGLDDEKRDQIALWTILSMRWPSLAAYLAQHPDDLDELRDLSSAAPEADERAAARDQTASHQEQRRDMLELARRPEVQAVLSGRGISTELDSKILKELVGWEDPRAGQGLPDSQAQSGA